MASIFQHRDGWRAQIRRKGYPTRSEVFPTKAQAERWARKIEAEMDGRKYLAPSGTSMRKLFERFRDEVCPTRKGCHWEQVRINKILRDCLWLNKEAEDVDRFDIQAWRDARLREVSGDSVNRELNLVSGIISHAMKEWGVALRINPVHEVKRPPKGKPRHRRVEPAELKALETKFKFDETRPPRVGYGAVRDSVMWVFHLAMETGMRCGELLALTWTDLNLAEGWLRVRDSKNGDGRVVPLTARAAGLLEKLKTAAGEDEPRVFPIDGRSFEATYRRACKDAGIVDLHFHDTRHEGASRLAGRLENAMDLAKVLGQRDPRTTMIYYNPTPGELVRKLRESDSRGDRE